MKTLPRLFMLFASIVVLTACSEEEDPLKLTINLPLNETMAWQGAFINYWTDSLELNAIEYIEMTLTSTKMLNDTLFYEGTIRILQIWNESRYDTTGPILISKTSVYLQQNFSHAYQFLLKTTGEQPSPPTLSRIHKVLMPVSLTEGKKQNFTHPLGAEWSESQITINPKGKKNVGLFSGMGATVSYYVPENNHTIYLYWLLDEKGKIWTLSDYGFTIRTDSLGNEIARIQVIETRHRISPQANPETYLKALTLDDFYLTRF